MFVSITLDWFRSLGPYQQLCLLLCFGARHFLLSISYQSLLLITHLKATGIASPYVFNTVYFVDIEMILFILRRMHIWMNSLCIHYTPMLSTNETYDKSTSLLFLSSLFLFADRTANGRVWLCMYASEYVDWFCIHSWIAAFICPNF